MMKSLVILILVNMLIMFILLMLRVINTDAFTALPYNLHAANECLYDTSDVDRVTISLL